MKEAYYYVKHDNGSVQCHLCPHRCEIPPGKRGRCRVRLNNDGVLIAENYGEISGIAFDPIEKKPLRNFYPGHTILSIGSYGCNLSCDFCQNWRIAQEHPPTQTVGVDELIQRLKLREDNLGLAYTYNEPTVFYEFMLDTAKAVHEAGYKNVVVSNGFISKEPLLELLPYIDAFNIDLKAFEERFYKGVCGGRLGPVLDTIRRIVGHAHLELTVLLIDGENTDDQNLEKLFEWVASLDKDIPIHLSRYFPAYKRIDPPTEVETLQHAKKLAEKYLTTVYLGNV